MEKSAGPNGAQGARRQRGAARPPLPAMAAQLGTGARAEDSGQEKQVRNSVAGLPASRWLGSAPLFLVPLTGWL